MSVRTRRKARRQARPEREPASVRTTKPPKPQEDNDDVRKKKNQILNELPEAAFSEVLATDLSRRVDVRVHRVNSASQAAVLKGMSRLTIPLRLVTALPERIGEIFGGGRFIIRVYDYGTAQVEVLIPPWYAVVDGPPRPIPDQCKFTIVYNDEKNDLEVVQVDDHGRFAPLVGGSVIETIRANSGVIPVSNPSSPAQNSPVQAIPQGSVALPPGVVPVMVNSPEMPPRTTDPYGRLQPPPDVPWARIPSDVRAMAPVQQWTWLETYRQYVFPPVESGAQKQQQSGDAALNVAMGWTQREQQQFALAQQANARMEAQMAALQLQFQQQKEAHTSQLLLIEKRNADLERQLERERGEAARRAEKSETEMRMARLEERLANGNSRNGSPDWASLVTALVPLGTALVQSSAARDSAAVQAQLEQQKTLLTTIAHRPHQPSLGEQITPVLAAIGPIIAPLLAQWMSNMDPAKIAALQKNTSHEQQAFLQMLIGFIRETTPQDNAPWWSDALIGFLNQMGGVAQAMSAQQTPKLPPPGYDAFDGQSSIVAERRAAAPMPKQPAPATAPPQPAAGPDLDGLIGTLAQLDSAAAQNTALVFQQLIKQDPVDPAWLTHEWIILIFNLHAKLADTALADLFVNHLDHCRAFGILPAALADVFTDPKGILSAGLFLMPIAMIDRPYVERVIAMVSEQILTDENEREEETDADPDPEDDAPDAYPENEAAVLAEDAAE